MNALIVRRFKHWNIEIDTDAFDAQSMTERDQFAGALGGENSRHARNSKYFAFGDSLFGDGAKRGAGHFNETFGERFAASNRFGADVDHRGLSLCIKMREFGFG